MGRSSITKMDQNAARASSNSSVLILLKLSSAFDTINHQILLSTLAELGIADSALTWFTSYLTNRTFQVTWNGSLSKPCFLETGVPQGPVLGLLLFSLYTRSLGSAITSHGFFYHCYADLHTQLVFSFPFYSDTHFATRTPECLADVAAANPLWPTILHPKHHCCGQILQIIQIYIICRIWSFLTTDSTQLLVQALVTSCLDYCNSLLAGLPAFATKPLQHIQNSAAPLFFSLLKFSHVTPLFCDLHWLPVAASIQFKNIQGHKQNCTRLPLNTGQTTRPSESTLLHYISWPAGAHHWEQIALLCSGASVVERTPDQCQDSRVTHHLPQKTQDPRLTCSDLDPA